MFKNRNSRIVLGAILIVAVGLVVLAVGPQAGASNPGAAPVGIGELRSFEATQLQAGKPAGIGDLRLYEAGISKPAAIENAGSPSYTGMGDLQFLEASQSLAPVAALKSAGGAVGMGDLHLVEASFASASSYAGMGDLHRFESR